MPTYGPGVSPSVYAKDNIVRRLLRRAAAVEPTNSWDSVMASPPTWAGSGTHNTALTNAYQPSVRTTDYSWLSGAPVAQSAAPTAFQQTQVHLPSGGNVPSGDVGAQTYTNVVEFMTDAPTLEFPMFYAQTPRALVNDQYISKTIPANSGGGNPTYMQMTFGSRIARRIRLELDGSAPFYGVNVDPASSVWLPDQSDIIRSCWFGNSITAGVGTSTGYYSNRYADVASKLLGWRSCQTAAIGGTSYQVPSTFWDFIAHVSDVNLTATDILVVSGGINEATATGLQAAVLAFLQAARTRLPGKPIIVLGSFSATTPTVLNLAVEAAISAAVAQFADPLCVFVPISSASTPWMTSAAVSTYIATGNSPHPNDAGHDFYGRRARDGILTGLRSMAMAA